MLKREERFNDRNERSYKYLKSTRQGLRELLQAQSFPGLGLIMKWHCSLQAAFPLSSPVG